MKNVFEFQGGRYIYLITLLTLISSLPGRAQYFTKITNVITTDNGNSRSVNWIDYDNDNDLDLYISNGVSPAMNAFLYENTGAGNFVKHEEAAVAQNNTRADGSSWADYNNDGYPDLYIVAWYGDKSILYQNTGAGNFIRIMDGVVGEVSGYSESCSWGDFDNDGFVDLYVANSGTSGSSVNYFYHNNCGESFTRITSGAPATDRATSRTVNWVDYDNDGDPDLFVSNESDEPNDLYRNMLKETGNAGFEAVANDPVVMSNTSSISSCWGDYNNDGYPDLFVANGWGQNNELFRNNGDGSFSKISDGIQCNDGGCSFGCNWADFENDGDLDLFVTNCWCSGDQNNFLYRNQLIETGNASFEKVIDTVITTDGGWSYGSSWGDFDNDGDHDLLVAKCSENGQENHNSLFRNDSGNMNNWITIECIGNFSNKSAIGAKVLVKSVINSEPVWQVREVSAQEGYCSENLLARFGLGNSSIIDTIVVKWPSGIIQYLTDVYTNQYLTIEEDTLLFTGTKPTCTAYTATKTIRADNAVNRFSFYPNPAIDKIDIRFQVSVPGLVDISLYNVNASVVRRIFNTDCNPGTYAVPFNAFGLPRGIYYLHFTSAGYTETGILVLAE